MYYSLDFGGSTTDVIQWEAAKIKKMMSFESDEIKKRPFLEILKILRLDLKKAEKILITGGKSRFFQNEIQGIPIIKVNEIAAIGKGGAFLWQKEEIREQNYFFEAEKFKKFLVVSMGTGTCLVKVDCSKKKIGFEHVGGTGVGGGTFLGLSKQILGETDLKRLILMFKKGDRKKVDLSVGEIVGGGIGKISETETAANLAKLWPIKREEIDFNPNDLAAGIINLIGQTIAMTAIFAAKAEKLPLIILTGKLTRVWPISEIIFRVGKRYQMPVILPEKADYVSALGAGEN